MLVKPFQLTAARRRLACALRRGWIGYAISTHSRAKAAGAKQHFLGIRSRFQLTAARRRLVRLIVIAMGCCLISTHSRAKAAGRNLALLGNAGTDFNSQPREGGWDWSIQYPNQNKISTHSRAKAAGSARMMYTKTHLTFQLTAARRRLGVPFSVPTSDAQFQLTAARRRLACK